MNITEQREWNLPSLPPEPPTPRPASHLQFSLPYPALPGPVTHSEVLDDVVGDPAAAVVPRGVPAQGEGRAGDVGDGRGAGRVRPV